MIRLFLIVFGLLTFGNTQKLDYLFKQVEMGEIEEVRKTLPVLEKKYPNNPDLKYLKGLTLLDGDSAFRIYKEIITKHSSSKFAEGASSKIGQYLYARGLYSQASQHLRKFIFRYPQSEDISRMMGMLIRSFDATGELDTAQIIVDQYFKKYTGQYLFKNDLGHIPDSIKGLKVMQVKLEPMNKQVIDSPKIQGSWMIQVGAFGVQKNAVFLEIKLKKSGYSVFIKKLSSNKGTLFAVRIGPFESRKFAKKKAIELKNIHGLDYQLLEIQK